MEHAIIVDIEKKPEEKHVPTLQDIYDMHFPTATVEQLEQIILEGICISTVMLDTIQDRIYGLKSNASMDESARLQLIEDKLIKMMSLLNEVDIGNISVPEFSVEEKKYLAALKETSILQAIPPDLSEIHSV